MNYHAHWHRPPNLRRSAAVASERKGKRAKAFARAVPVALGLSGPTVLTSNGTAAYQVGGLEPGGLAAVIWGLSPGTFSYTIPRLVRGTGAEHRL